MAKSIKSLALTPNRLGKNPIAVAAEIDTARLLFNNINHPHKYNPTKSYNNLKQLLDKYPSGVYNNTQKGR